MEVKTSLIKILHMAHPPSMKIIQEQLFKETNQVLSIPTTETMKKQTL